MRSKLHQASRPLSASRRQLLAALATSPLLLPLGASAQSSSLLSRPIPSTGEAVPVIGLGSWITFNVGNDPAARDDCAEVMRDFFAAGGRLIDSSPMYGSSQEVIGYGLARSSRGRGAVFAADKVWILAARAVRRRSRRRAGTGACRVSISCRCHNLLAWEEHLPTLLRDEGGGPAALRRHHDLRRAAPRRVRADHAQASRSTSCRSPTTSLDREVERAHPAAGARARHRRHRQPAVPPGRADRQFDSAQPHCPAWAARDRLRELGADPAEVRRFRIRRSPAPSRPPSSVGARSREHGRRASAACRMQSMRRRIVAHVEKL